MKVQTVDLVLYNANVLTLNPRQPRADLLVIGGDRIVWVGTLSDLDTFKGQANLLDCQGKTVVPGFNDAHIHILAYASSLLSVDCSPAFVKSISDIQARIRDQAKRIPRGTWIKASGYNEFYLRDHRHPTRHDLDQAAPYHPVKLTHRSLHACVLNSQALSLARIAVDAPEPPGGLIDRELETGNPSGLLFGMNSYINEHVIPPMSEEELANGLNMVNQSLLSLGITSVQDATLTNGYDQWKVFQKAKKNGQFTPRTYLMFGNQALSEIVRRELITGSGDTSLKAGAIKIVLDEIQGKLNPSQEVLNETALTAHQAGCQLAIHCIEERTVEAAINAVKYCLEKIPRYDHRHRLEHCSVCPPALLRQLQDIKALVVTQPAFIYYSGERYLKEIPVTKLSWLYRTGSFLESGLKIAASSDCPVVPCNPLAGVYAAVTRRSESGQGISPDERVNAEDALRIFTLGGAYASFEEHLKGSIEAGKLADLAILSADPTTATHDRMNEIHVKKTIVGGQVVWEL